MLRILGPEESEQSDTSAIQILDGNNIFPPEK